jgi:predicted dehydrogenase
MPEIAEFVASAREVGGWLEGRVDHVGSIYTEGNPFGASAWRRESGGLWDVGPHALALLLPILGPVTEVTAMAGVRDMIHVLTRHEGGAIGALTLSVDAPPAAGREEALIAGEAGVRTAPDAPWDPVPALGRAIDELLAAAAGGPTPELDVRFGARITAILAAAQESIRTGHTTTV